MTQPVSIDQARELMIHEERINEIMDYHFKLIRVIREMSPERKKLFGYSGTAAESEYKQTTDALAALTAEEARHKKAMES